MAERFDIGVIGLGAMGSAALHALARRGQRVVGFERVAPGHEGGSSHGESRIIRLAYFEDPSYVALLRGAYENWRKLEQYPGQILETTGIVEGGHRESELVRRSLACSEEHGLGSIRLTAAELAERFPAFTLPGGWHAAYNASGGILRPERAIECFIGAACTQGAVLRPTGIRELRPIAGSVRLIQDDGSTLEVGAAVVCAGAWMGELFPRLLGPRLAATRQVMAWMAPQEPALVQLGRLPVFILETPDDIVYGFPDLDGAGVKAGSHRRGRLLPTAGAARQDAAPEEADVVRVREALARYLPAAAGEVRQVKTCIYTNTADGDFIIDRHPDCPEIVLASACSGHGFKFASVLGEVLADLAQKQEPKYDLSRFRLARFNGT